MRRVQELFDLTGKVALVTGGSRGLGEEIAEGLAEAGAAVMIVARREQWLTPALDALRKQGFHCEGAICDVSKPEDVQASVAKTIQAFGQIDILVNNAGITWGAPAEEMPLDKWRMVLDVNLTGAFLFCQAAGIGMIERRFGRIINIASINGIQGGLPMADIAAAGYVASKAGLIGLTRELAAKWAKHSIRVNAIAPGYFPTRMTEKIWDQTGEFLKASPMGRGGRDEEMKGVGLFLASDASNYITGQTIIVDGGTVLV